MDPTRVFIVDDSAVSRMVLRHALDDDSRIEVIGEAANGREAVEALRACTADIVLMDIMMPRLNGIEATAELMRTRAVPVLIVSDLVGRDTSLNFQALEAGALEVIRKPSARELGDPGAVARLRRRVLRLAEVPVITRTVRASPPANPAPSPAPSRVGDRPTTRLVCIGASTGGPPALARILSSFTAPPPWPIVIVQHMSPGFTAGMASWLEKVTALPVRLASTGTTPEAGVVYIADEGHHLEIRSGRFVLNNTEPFGGHRPAVDALFDSVAENGIASRTTAILLSGMGCDGARGLQRIRRAGGWTIAQDERTSAVYGMPRAAVELGAVCEELPLEEITHRLRQQSGNGPTP